MAFEQVYAYFDGRPQSELGPTVEIGLDRFPMLESSELKVEHERLNHVIEGCNSWYVSYLKSSVYDEIVATSKESVSRYYRAFFERVFAYFANLRTNPGGECMDFFAHNGADMLAALFKASDKSVDLIEPTLLWLSGTRLPHPGILREVFDAIGSDGKDKLNERMIKALQLIRGNLFASSLSEKHELKLAINSLAGSGICEVVLPGEYWTDRMLEDLSTLNEAEQDKWLKLLTHCGTASSGTASAKWMAAGEKLLNDVTKEKFAERFVSWCSLVDKGKSGIVFRSLHDQADDRQRINDINADMLRGMLWLCIKIGTPELTRAITKVALSAYRKIPGVGPRAVKVGNAAVYVLGEIANKDAVGQMAILKVRVKFGTAQKMIEKALNTTAAKVGIPAAELEEMSVPSYGLTGVGERTEEFGDYKFELKIEGNKAEGHWFNAEGKQLKSVPDAVKKEFAEDLKEIKQSVADVDKMIPAQSARIEQLYLQKKSWDMPIWKKRYNDHPLVGSLARRLIWNFVDGDEKRSGFYNDGKFVHHDGSTIDGITEKTRVTLWHPLDERTDDVIAWREWLLKHQIKQPFKQAYREIYVLTDAERTTNTYSNRFAAHILKQHQFNALCLARGWKNKLRMMVDDEYPPPHIDLPVWGLRAEYWVEGAGTAYGSDTTDSGSYLYLTTDQVRFYDIKAAPNAAHACGGGYGMQAGDNDVNRSLTLDKIPAMVFSEVMRDVDLFVGVSSVANDPAWSDGGPEGRYLDYWSNYSFGELGVSSQLRKEVLARLIPHLKIADRCSFSERFLIVRGDLRTYKIHCGSGNILMEPNDQYLCIVPKQSVSAKADQTFLPFEGDNMLSIILSKAFMLAEDTKIKDETITRQIGGKVSV